ncbi:MAG: response regulator transcription factor [Spirochaetaceae bacterium]|nr:response regulator transcription factor [Spirochaetaceae bacterium]
MVFMKHIAIVDDEAALRENLSYALNKEGYRVSVYPNGQAAWEARQDDSPDLYLLDILMPRMDGIEFCRLLRRNDTRTPVIFLSSRDEELDRVLGLETGGDDYIGKPFSVRELLARIKAVLRRADGIGQGEPPIDVGPLKLDPDSYKASWNDEALVFTLSEYRLLSELARSPGTVRTRSALYSSAFPEDKFINERAVDSHIKRIRRKLEVAGAPKNILETIYGLGYRLRIED